MPTLPATTPYAPKRILIPVDGAPLSGTAVAAALALAPSPTAVTLLHVTGQHGLAGEASLDAVDALAAGLRSRFGDASVETVLAQGDPVTEILHLATEMQPDLIAMATREHLPPAIPSARTISVQVAQATSRPVLVVHACDHDWRPQRVVVPLDGSLRSLQALPVAAGMATQGPVPVHLVAVIDPAASLPAAYAWSCPECDPDLQDALQYLQCQANDMLNQAERSLRAAGVMVTSDLRLGKTTPVLLAAIQPGDVVVMTTRGVDGHQGSHAGSVATEILRHSPAPVVAFHPRLEPTVIHTGFETGLERDRQPARR
jgi:nucleotide-binding universal stress UspA family protein